MNNMHLLLRVLSGLLSLAAFALAGIRLYGYSVTNVQLGTEGFMSSLRLLFPLSLGLFFGYMAIKGKMPFLDDHKNNNE